MYIVYLSLFLGSLVQHIHLKNFESLKWMRIEWLIGKQTASEWKNFSLKVTCVFFWLRKHGQERMGT